ncbi:hypothetical protein [Nitrosopumilus adriaticus]|uniref:Uncharacterized protein n=1 Tax=Nitrosopumilus adriaticus TaxID=1580092 RepID=A0A0D5C1P3_9ARCH|nr:hypothetical protein [Nitrosopumilus adriaticus]AJW70297.1 hypothetical protein NADRNF5_0601 [Nitrosopumilus adriaticus]
MTAMETLLASPFEKTFSDFVSYDEITKIKNSLFEQHHMTLLSSIKDFEKFQTITGQVLGDDCTPLIKKTLDVICRLESKARHTVEIKDESLKSAILESFDDPVKKQILDIAFDYPITIWEIVSRAKKDTENISENISYLISHGLLATNDLGDSEHNKKYYSTIDSFEVKVDDDEFNMYVTINEIANSDPLKIIC